MKRKIVVVNLLVSFAVLFAMLFQTVHSYEHLFKQLAHKHCEHNYTPGQKEITHAHSAENNCPVCHFAFSSFIPNSFQTFSFTEISTETLCLFLYTKVSTSFFKGSLFALRAPPVIS
ncbi:hypothetical protein [Flavobacterium gelatinilyticum]|uniref:hypothetical protein n=1 Tax=Flavobacterium gelatinilyticum TaxID=3003260 RepID=UPI002480FB22|nr:hypothetical protein [Flavobacterium gelatinilyticum]